MSGIYGSDPPEDVQRERELDRHLDRQDVARGRC